MDIATLRMQAKHSGMEFNSFVERLIVIKQQLIITLQDESKKQIQKTHDEIHELEQILANSK